VRLSDVRPPDRCLRLTVPRSAEGRREKEKKRSYPFYLLFFRRGRCRKERPIAAEEKWAEGRKEKKKMTSANTCELSPNLSEGEGEADIWWNGSLIGKREGKGGGDGAVFVALAGAAREPAGLLGHFARTPAILIVTEMKGGEKKKKEGGEKGSTGITWS